MFVEKSLKNECYVSAEPPFACGDGEAMVRGNREAAKCDSELARTREPSKPCRTFGSFCMPRQHTRERWLGLRGRERKCKKRANGKYWMFVDKVVKSNCYVADSPPYVCTDGDDMAWGFNDETCEQANGVGQKRLLIDHE